jgi:hypothetical protein
METLLSTDLYHWIKQMQKYMATPDCIYLLLHINFVYNTAPFWKYYHSSGCPNGLSCYNFVLHIQCNVHVFILPFHTLLQDMCKSCCFICQLTLFLYKCFLIYCACFIVRWYGTNLWRHHATVQDSKLYKYKTCVKIWTKGHKNMS